MTYPNGWDGPGYYAAQLAPEQVRTDWTAPIGEPGIVPPRPLQLGDILGGAFRAVRYAPLTMFGLTVALVMVAELLGLGVGYVLSRQFGGSFMDTGSEDYFDAGLFSWTTLTSSLTSSVTGVVVGMGLIYAVSEAAAARRASPQEALRRMGSRLWAALGFSLVCAVPIAAWFAVLLAGFGSASAGPKSLAVLGTLVAVPLAIWLGTRLILAPAVISVERLGPLRAIRRSWFLTHGQFWRMLGIYALSSVIISLAAGTVSSVFSFAGALLGIADANLALIGMTTASSLTSSVLSLPLTAAVQGLLYVDARIRREGYDLQLSEALYG